MTQEEMLLEAAQTGFFYFILLEMSYKLNDFAYVGYFGAVSDICQICIFGCRNYELEELGACISKGRGS